MDANEFRSLLNRIAENRENQGLVTELLTQAGDEFETVHTSASGLESQTQELNDQISQLQRTNMDLFLRVGNPEQTNQSTNDENDNQLTFDNLLKEGFGIERNDG